VEFKVQERDILFSFGIVLAIVVTRNRESGVLFGGLEGRETIKSDAFRLGVGRVKERSI
jgi:hypothetical protein